MSYQPILPATGNLGWTFFKKTEAKQALAFRNSAEIQRDATYFREKIATADSARALVSDRRLLRISLEAFGLEADVSAVAFIRKVLEGGTENRAALANRLADPLYAEFAATFGYGNSNGPNTGKDGFADAILKRWTDRRFEAAVGAKDNDLRLAMNARRDLLAIAEGNGTERAKWFKILGRPPLRTVVQGALGLAPSFGALDLDLQVSQLQKRMASVFGSGTVTQLKDPDKVEAVINRFLAVRDGTRSGTENPALMLLQTARLNRRL